MAGTLNISRDRKEDGIVQFLEDVSSIRKIENTYRCIKIKDISQDIDFSACLLRGKRKFVVTPVLQNYFEI